MIVGSFVVKNEADRYFSESIQSLSLVCDKIFVFDDNSTDGTVAIAEKFADEVVVNSGFSFMEHEGEFRHNAWKSCIRSFDLTEEDWILVVDADEFVAVDGKRFVESDLNNLVFETKNLLSNLILNKMCLAYKIHIYDVKKFDIANNDVKIRIDGLWNKNYAPRLSRAIDLPFWDKKMGSFSIPKQMVQKAILPETCFKLLHLGHCDENDMVERYERYSSLKNHGHNKKHIESIVKNPELQNWQGGVVIV